MHNLDAQLKITPSLIQAPNLTDRFSEEDLDKIGQLVYQGYVRDKASRSPWERRMETAMDLAMQVQKEKNFPWAGSANVIFPLITIAAMQFSARSYSNLVQGPDVVKYRVAGEDPDGKMRDQGDRISRHMSWQVLEEDHAWEEEHDRLLVNLGIVGTAFTKSYYSSERGHIVSELVMARDLVIDYYARSLDTCARKTHIIPLYKNEIYERVKRGVFRDVLNEAWYQNASPPPPRVGQQQENRQGMTNPGHEEEFAFTTLEQHRLLDLDGDGYAEPYIVTIDETSRKVLRIVARFERMEDVERTTKGEILRIKPTEYFTKYSFIPAPDGGIYDVGFGILLGPLNESVNSGINQLLDSGTIQNSMGGFLGRGAKIRGGVYTMAPWEWKRVDSTGDDLRKSLVPFPERQPSAVMFNLLALLIEYTDRLAGTTDAMVGVNPGQNTPAETSRNMIEQGSQIFNTIFKRVWRSMKDEFKKRHILNSFYLRPSQRFGADSAVIRKEDYLMNPDLVIPVADPNITSQAMRMTQATMLSQRAMMVPGYDLQEVERNFVKALKVEGAEKFYPGPDKVPPLPNPAAQAEMMKVKVKQMELEYRKQEFMMEMMETRRLNSAKIAQLSAQAVKMMAEAEATGANVQLDALRAAIEAFQAQNQAINERLQTMNGGSENGTGGGVSSMEGSPGDAGGLESPDAMAGGLEGAMGAGELPS